MQRLAKPCSAFMRSDVIFAGPFLFIWLLEPLSVSSGIHNTIHLHCEEYFLFVLREKYLSSVLLLINHGDIVSLMFTDSISNMHCKTISVYSISVPVVLAVLQKRYQAQLQ